MRAEFMRGECSAVIGSMTQAMKAQKVLERASIPARVEKADSSVTRKGCAYAVVYGCVQEANVRAILQRAGIPVRGGTGGF